ncbi:MAG: DUF2065 domain-containing protein [Pseudomonadota bacterium]
MDLLAALALVMVIEGLAIVVFSSSLPELLAAMKDVDEGQMRRIGIIAIVGGAVLYLMIRGAAGAG